MQGLSRFASDIIIQGFDTPFKGFADPRGRNYAGFVTRLLQPVLPVFFSIKARHRRAAPAPAAYHAHTRRPRTRRAHIDAPVASSASAPPLAGCPLV